MDINGRLLIVVKKYSGNGQMSIDSDLEKELGISGDDAYDLIKDYGLVFNVDVSAFVFNKYFYDEGEQMIRFFHWCTGRYKRRKFTLVDLQQGIELGKLL